MPTTKTNTVRVILLPNLIITTLHQIVNVVYYMIFAFLDWAMTLMAEVNLAGFNRFNPFFSGS